MLLHFSGVCIQNIYSLLIIHISINSSIYIRTGYIKEYSNAFSVQRSTYTEVLIVHVLLTDTIYIKVFYILLESRDGRKSDLNICRKYISSNNHFKVITCWGMTALCCYISYPEKSHPVTAVSADWYMFKRA